MLANFYKKKIFQSFSPETINQAKEQLTHLIESIIVWSENKYGAESFSKARGYFNKVIGLANHDEVFFDQFCHYFLDYYIFTSICDTDYKGNPITPVQAFLDSVEYTQLIKRQDQAIFAQQLRLAHHSLFLIEKFSQKDQIIKVKDLYTSTVFSIIPTNDQVFCGFISGETIQGFVIPMGKVAFLLTGYFCHSKSTLNFLKEQTLKTKSICPESYGDFLLKTAYMFRRACRYPHIKAKAVYLLEPNIR